MKLPGRGVDRRARTLRLALGTVHRQQKCCVTCMLCKSEAADDVICLHSQFNTNFTEMDALSGRTQTTKGIWLARSPKVTPG